jgi:hypothetical protein
MPQSAQRKDVKQTRIRQGAAILGAAFMVLTSVAAARDDGRYQNVDPTLKAWVKSLTDKKGNGCCDTADGYPAEVEWDNDTGHYRVRIAPRNDLKAEWYEVPEEAIIEKPNRLGYAMVWWYPSFLADGRLVAKIRCFIPGAGG